MEYQFFQEGLLGEMFWLEVLPLNQSAFVRYTNTSIEGFRWENSVAGVNDRNMNKRMMQFLRRSCPTATIETRELERERCFQHMMSERMRREKQKECYSALHSMLPLGTKGDKNSIIQMTVMKIQELQRYKEELRRRNGEIEAILAERVGEQVGGTRINLRVANPISGIDSMVEVLQCLKNLGLKTRTIKSKYSAQEFAAELEIETNMIGGAAEVEKAVQRTLAQVETKLRLRFPEGWS